MTHESAKTQADSESHPLRPIGRGSTADQMTSILLPPTKSTPFSLPSPSNHQLPSGRVPLSFGSNMGRSSPMSAQQRRRRKSRSLKRESLARRRGIGGSLRCSLNRQRNSLWVMLVSILSYGQCLSVAESQTAAEDAEPSRPMSEAPVEEGEEGEEMEATNADDEAMMAMMGMSGFGSTKVCGPCSQCIESSHAQFHSFAGQACRRQPRR